MTSTFSNLRFLGLVDYFTVIWFQIHLPHLWVDIQRVLLVTLKYSKISEKCSTLPIVGIPNLFSISSR